MMRVGFEICQNQIGTEVSSLKQLGEVKDFVGGKNIIFTDGHHIESYNEKKVIVSSECLGEEK